MFMPQQPKLTPEQKAILRQRTMDTMSNFVLVVLTLRAEYMFSKAKRFQDEATACIPGPGEYDVAAEDLTKHRHYGFIGHSPRFTEEGDHFYVGGDVSTASLSTDTRLSLSTSSNWTESRKLAGEQFDKYRAAAQKEIEALYLKTRKLEASVQTADTEKTTAQAALLSREQELADLRAKNATMQKTLTRHERAPKALQLQRKLEQTQQELDAANAQFSQARQCLEEEQKQREALTTEHNALLVETEQQKSALEKITTELISTKEALSVMKNDNEAMVVQMQEESQRMQAEQDLLREEIKQLINSHQRALEDRDNKLEACLHRQAELDQQLRDTLLENGTLQSEQLADRSEISRLHEKIDEDANSIHRLEKETIRVQSQFEIYRAHVATMMQAMRTKSSKQLCERQQALDGMLSELSRAKRFINQQGRQVEALKSELHWTSKACKNLFQTVCDMSQESAEQIQLYSRKPSTPRTSPTTNTTPIDSTSNNAQISSLSTEKIVLVESCTDAITDSNDQAELLNDSGFGMMSSDSK